MALEIEGKLFKILPMESGINQQTGKEWRKQMFVIETDEQYPRKVCFTVWNENCDILKNLKINDKLEISFRLESREYNERWYTDAIAWKITKIVKETLVSGQQANASIYEKDKTVNEKSISEDNMIDNGLDNDFTQSQSDDLPF